MSVSSCRCMFVSYVLPVAVLNAAFCMTCSLLMLVEDARVDHMEEAYSRAGLMEKHCTTYGNTPTGFGPYLRPKTRIHPTHSQHLSTSTQATTNDKSTHSNMMG